jgi:hypothetical protein
MEVALTRTSLFGIAAMQLAALMLIVSNAVNPRNRRTYGRE